MNLSETVIAASIGAILGWLIKAITDGLSNWTVERKLANLAIYQLYQVLDHIDAVINSYEMWVTIRRDVNDVSLWKSMFSDANNFAVKADLLSTTQSLAAFDPILA